MKAADSDTLQEVLGIETEPFFSYMTATFKHYFVNGTDMFDMDRTRLVEMCAQIKGLREEWALTEYRYLTVSNTRTPAEKKVLMEMEALRFVSCFFN